MEMPVVANAPRMVVFDLDATLMDRREQLSVRTRRMLAALSDAGIAWTAATGRSPGKLVVTGITEMVRLPIVCATGAVMVHVVNGQVQRLPGSAQLTPEVIATTIAEVLRRHPKAVFGVDRFENLVAGPGYPPLPDWVTTTAVNTVDELSVETGDVLRVWAPDAPSLAISGWDAVQWRDIGRPGYIEAVAAGTSKTAAIAKLAAELGIAREAVWMFGDGANDTDLLEWAGTGIAMRNAVDEAIAAADAMTVYGHDDDGVARLLEAVLDVWRPLGAEVAEPMSWAEAGNRDEGGTRS